MTGSFAEYVEKYSLFNFDLMEKVEQIKGMFPDVGFSVLYSWLPGDIAGAISTCIRVLLLLAVIGVLKRIWDALPIA